MYHVSAQGVDECMINIHYYYYMYACARECVCVLAWVCACVRACVCLRSINCSWFTFFKTKYTLSKLKQKRNAFTLHQTSVVLTCPTSTETNVYIKHQLYLPAQRDRDQRLHQTSVVLTCPMRPIPTLPISPEIPSRITSFTPS